MWFTAACSGYATDLNSMNISGNLYFNQILFSVLIALSKPVSCDNRGDDASKSLQKIKPFCCIKSSFRLQLLVALDATTPAFSRRILHQYSQAIVCVCFLALCIIVTLNEHVSALSGLQYANFVFVSEHLDSNHKFGRNNLHRIVGDCSQPWFCTSRLFAVLGTLVIWAPSKRCRQICA